MLSHLFCALAIRGAATDVHARADDSLAQHPVPTWSNTLRHRLGHMLHPGASLLAAALVEPFRNYTGAWGILTSRLAGQQTPEGAPMTVVTSLQTEDKSILGVHDACVAAQGRVEVKLIIAIALIADKPVDHLGPVVVVAWSKLDAVLAQPDAPQPRRGPDGGRKLCTTTEIVCLPYDEDRVPEQVAQTPRASSSLNGGDGAERFVHLTARHIRGDLCVLMVAIVVFGCAFRSALMEGISGTEPRVATPGIPGPKSEHGESIKDFAPDLTAREPTRYDCAYTHPLRAPSAWRRLSLQVLHSRYRQPARMALTHKQSGTRRLGGLTARSQMSSSQQVAALQAHRLNRSSMKGECGDS